MAVRTALLKRVASAFSSRCLSSITGGWTSLYFFTTRASESAKIQSITTVRRCFDLGGEPAASAKRILRYAAFALDDQRAPLLHPKPQSKRQPAAATASATYRVSPYPCPGRARRESELSGLFLGLALWRLSECLHCAAALSAALLRTVVPVIGAFYVPLVVIPRHLNPFCEVEWNRSQRIRAEWQSLRERPSHFPDLRRQSCHGRQCSRGASTHRAAGRHRALYLRAPRRRSTQRAS